MSLHILLMNVLAPLAVLGHLALHGRAGDGPSGRTLLIATLVQLGVLWAAHVPAVLGLTMRSPALHFGLQGALLLSALWFWWAALAQRRRHLWRAILAFLMTGKLFCMPGVLLVFAPRVLYPDVVHVHADADAGAGGAADLLADQQLAGLLMLVACPLSYVLAGTIVAAQWLREQSATGGSTPVGFGARSRNSALS